MKIMFVCHGNICRSPMAEAIFNNLIPGCSRPLEFSCESSATSTEEIIGGVGNPIYPPAREELRRHGITPPERRARLLRTEDYDNFDLFVGMDLANVRNMHRIFGGDPDKKIRLLGKYAGFSEVDDPWYSRDFSKAYSDIHKGCAALLNALVHGFDVI